MQKLIQTLFITTSLTLAACGGKQEGGSASLTGKKSELEKLKKDQVEISNKISTLEKEIAQLDTSSSKEETAKLVGTSDITTQNFSHYIDLQGRVDADDISYISPRLGGGQVRAIYVKRGDFVKKGQLLVKLDDAMVKQQVTAARQNIETLKSQLSFARDVYNRRNNLWKQGIGSEIELISSRTNVETLEKQISAAEENVKTLQEQQSGANIYSNVDGIADEVNVRVGELFTGFSGTLPQIRIVNTNSLKVVADIPENYSGKVKQGSSLTVTLPDINKTFNTSISVAGKVIDPNNRSFRAEAKLPSDGSVRPNQIALVRILDYNASNAIAIPVNTIGTDEKGKYAYISVNENGKLVARKKQISIGEMYNDKVEVKTGLNAGDKLITEGYQNIYDGQLLRVK